MNDEHNDEYAASEGVNGMHWSSDVLSAMRSSRRYELTEQRLPPHRATPTHTTPLAAATEPDRPDYGCVDWFVYEEPSEQKGAA